VETSLADDEHRLGEIADALADGLTDALAPWLVYAATKRAAAAERVLDAAETDRVRRVAAATAADLAPRVRRVLGADVDSGLGSPLSVIREGTAPFTGMLQELGLPAGTRDEFARKNFPADIYGLGPAAFADVHESLHELGLMWGAARAHVHLRRRREIEAGDR
jgi:hypothetical protein